MALEKQIQKEAMYAKYVKVFDDVYLSKKLLKMLKGFALEEFSLKRIRSFLLGRMGCVIHDLTKCAITRGIQQQSLSKLLLPSAYIALTVF